MNIRNWLFGHFVPLYILEKLLVTRLAGKGLALMYHEVLPDSDAPAAWTVLKASSFQQQMKFLVKWFDVISIDEALWRVSSDIQFVKPFVVVTFDDGYRGNLTSVLPIIEDLKVPITVYISSSMVESGQVYWYDKIIALIEHPEKLNIDLFKFNLGGFSLNSATSEKARWGQMQQLLTALKTLTPKLREDAVQEILCRVGGVPVRLRMLSADEVRFLSSSPFVTIGGHSHCHNILPQISDTELKFTLGKNCELLEQWTGQDIKHFSYPNGDFDERVVAAVSAKGFISAATTKNGFWFTNVNFFQLPRFGVGRFDSLGLILARFAGVT